MKLRRIIVGLLWVLSLVGISFYGGPVSYGFFIMITLLPVISLVYLCVVRWRFKIYQRLEGKSFVSNHAIPYFFTLQNEDRFAFASIRTFFYADFSTVTGLPDGVEYELLPGTRIERDTTVIGRYRGTYRVGIRTVEITDFLRLFRFRYTNREPVEVSIRPNVVTLADPSGLQLARVLSRDYPFGATVPDFTVREYAPGDPYRRIQWKATAREQRLMVRRVTGEAQPNVSILLSAFRFQKEITDYLPTENKMLEIALALADFFLRQGIPSAAFFRTDMLTRTDIVDRDSFDLFYEHCSDILFYPIYGDGNLFAETIRQPGVADGRAAFLILNTWTAKAERLASLLNAGSVPVIVYLVSDRKEAPDTAHLPLTEIFVISPEADLQEVL